MAPNKRINTRSSILRSNFKTQQCDFKCKSGDILDKNEEQCQRESENEAVNTNTESHVTNELMEVAEDISSPSQSKPECNYSKNSKTYKSHLQPIAKYFRTFGLNNKPINNKSSEFKETTTLHASSQDSSRCSNGVSAKVSANFTIDLSETSPHCFLLNTYIETPFQKYENSESFRKNVLVRKSSNEEYSDQPLPKKAKADHEGNVIKKAQRTSPIPKLSFDFSDDEGEEKINLSNGSTKCPTMYSCKHCDFSELNITHMVSHYDNVHPYVRYKATYIQDPCDESATFHCLECPAEFLSVLDLQRHYTKNHPHGPGFQLTTNEFQLAHKCFVCSYTTKELNDLETHYREAHPCENIPKETNKAEVSLSLINPEHKPEVSKSHAELKDPSWTVKPAADIHKGKKPPAKSNQSSLSKSTFRDMYYCQFCTFSSPNIMSVVGHRAGKHFAKRSTNSKEFILYNPQLKEKLQSKTETPLRTPDSDSRKQVCRNGDHKHQMDKAPEASIPSLERVNKHMVLICEEIKTKLQENNASFPHNLPLPILRRNDKQMFFCHLCNHRQRTLQQVLYHCSKSHQGVAVSSKDVERHTSNVLQQRNKSVKRITGQKDKHLQGKKEVDVSRSKPDLEKDTAATTEQQRSLQCCQCRFNTLCVTDLKKHVWEMHNSKRSSLDILRECFRQGNILPGYHCDVCVFSHTQAAVVYEHFQEQHPDQKTTLEYVNTQLHVGPVLVSLKKRKVESKGASPTFHAYQVPLEFETSAGSPQASLCPFSENFQCSFCLASFPSQNCLDIHCVRKHKGDTMNNDSIHTRVNFYTCPHCPYVNVRYQRIRRHCQRKHSGLSSGANRFSVDKIYANHFEEIMKNEDPLRVGGYICKICSQICATWEKLKRHCNEVHVSTEASSYLNDSKSAPGVSNVNRNYTAKLCNPPKSGPKVSLSNEVNKYVTSSLKAQECFYTCALCPKFFVSRKHLGEHYVEKHGKEAFSKYCAPLDKGVNETTNLPQSNPDSAPSQQNTSEPCNSSSTAAEKKLVFKCPRCPYVNASHSGTLAHCRMRHPRLVTRKCKFQTDKVNVAAAVKCQSVVKGSSFRGYACRQCPQIHNSLKMLRIHCDLEHNGIKPIASDDPDSTNHQPEFCQGSVPEAISTPSTNSSQTCPSQRIAQAEPKQDEQVECKVCSNLTFDSAQQLISHYNTRHFSACMLDFIVISQASEKNSGLYRCCLCQTQVQGVPNLHRHLDYHMERAEQAVELTETKGLVVDLPQIKSSTTDVTQDSLLMFETVEDLAQWNVSPVETFTAPLSPPSLLIKPTDVEKPQLELERDEETCKYYVFFDPVETDNQAEEKTLRVNEGRPISSQEASNASALNGKAALTEELLCSETPDVKTPKLLETCHSACLSKPNHVEDFHCPFCLYQTENKNKLIHHIISHREEHVVPGEARPLTPSHGLLCSFTSSTSENPHMHVMKQEAIQPYRCRLCYFDCTQLKDLEAHLTDKHQVIRNHELVSELVLSQQEACVSRVSVEPWSDKQDHSNGNLDVKMHKREAKSQGEDDNIRGDRPQIDDPNGKSGNEEFPSKSSVSDLQKDDEKEDSRKWSRMENTQQKEKEVAKEVQVHQLHVGRLKRKILQKSDGNLSLNIKYKVVSGSLLREPKSTTMASDHNTCSHKKSSAETAIQNQILVDERSLLSLKHSCEHQLISNRNISGPSFTPCRKKQLDNPSKEGKKGKGTPQDKNQYVIGKRRASTGTTEDKRFVCDLCGRSLMNNHELQHHISLHGQ